MRTNGADTKGASVKLMEQEGAKLEMGRKEDYLK